MVLLSFVKINLLFRIMDPLKRKSPSSTDLVFWNDKLYCVYLFFLSVIFKNAKFRCSINAKLKCIIIIRAKQIDDKYKLKEFINKKMI